MLQRFDSSSLAGAIVGSCKKKNRYMLFGRSMFHPITTEYFHL